MPMVTRGKAAMARGETLCWPAPQPLIAVPVSRLGPNPSPSAPEPIAPTAAAGPIAAAVLGSSASSSAAAPISPSAMRAIVLHLLNRSIGSLAVPVIASDPVMWPRTSLRMPGALRLRHRLAPGVRACRSDTPGRGLAGLQHEGHQQVDLV